MPLAEPAEPAPAVDGAAVLAVDIGGTKTTAALVEVGAGSARVLAHRTAPTPAPEGGAAVLEAALRLAEEIRGGTAIAAVGVASAGVIDGARGRVSHATSSLPRWAGTDVAGAFSDRFAVPARVLNDVHAHGLGEARFGAGVGASSMLLAAIGTGIGGCHVVDGRVMTGAHGAAGHIGHVPTAEAEGIPCPCGRTGHLEGLASGPGILALAERLGAPTAALGSGRALARAAAAGDETALCAYAIAGRATGRMLGALLNVLDVDVVALTGGVSGVGPFWLDPLREGLAAESMDVVASVPVVPATAGVHAALLGAAAHALDAQTP